MKINITSGQLLNKILEDLYPEDHFIPFNEAMITGSYSAKLFSEEFCLERAKVHNVSLASYKETMKDFLEFLKKLDEYDELVLWFGEEPFCQENRKAIMQVLTDYGFLGNINLNIVDENNGDILDSSVITL